MPEEAKIKDEQYISKWVSMLNIFKGLIKDAPPVKEIRSDLEELIDEAKLTTFLTPAQKSGIIERCNNYINGSYGKNLSTSSNKAI